MRREVLSEMIGTFVMVFVGCYSIKQGFSTIKVSLSFGIAVFSVILLSRKYSGAHINPAVSIAFCITGELDKKLVIPYVFAQIFGATLAALLVGNYGATQFSVNMGLGIGIEILITFLLMLSIYVVISKTDNDIIVATVVGITVAALAFVFGDFTGASMNPARTFGPNLISGMNHLIPIYMISTIVGAIIASAYKNLRMSDK